LKSGSHPLVSTIVVDERGAVVGLVTVEDLVEELLGNIFSERPRVGV